MNTLIWFWQVHCHQSDARWNRKESKQINVVSISHELCFDRFSFQKMAVTLAGISSIENWAAKNRMSLNFSKTWEMLLRSRTTKPAPPPVPGIERKEWLKLLGITFHEDPCNWDLHIDSLLSRAASRLYILRICKYYGYSKDQLSKLFDSLIMSLFLYGLQVWASANQGKY